MFQKLYEDKIGTLTQATGTISLAASKLTIGGMQFINSSALTLAVGSPAANTLYYIYAVRSAGNTILVSSTNVNSVGPATYTSWKLVGAYYSNGLASPAFGSFVNIEGKPQTSWMAYVPTSQGLGTLSNINVQCMRNGPNVMVRGRITVGSGTAVEARVGLPGITVSSGQTGRIFDGIMGPEATSSTRLHIVAENGDTFVKFAYLNGANNVSTLITGDALLSSTVYVFSFSCPINEWITITDLKSL